MGSSLPSQTTLIQALSQFGPDITSDPELVQSLFARFGLAEQSPPADAQVIDMFVALSRLTAEGAQICDAGTLVRALCALPGVHVDWSRVIEAFDLPDRQAVDTNTLKLLIAILLNSPRDA